MGVPYQKMRCYPWSSVPKYRDVTSIDKDLQNRVTALEKDVIDRLNAIAASVKDGKSKASTSEDERPGAAAGDPADGKSQGNQD